MTTPVLSTTERTTRATLAEVVATSVNALARETDLPIATAAELRRIFLIERIALETLCVQVDGSAHHTRAGDPGPPSADTEVSDADDDEETDLELDPDAPEPPGVGTQQYTYLGDGVGAAVDAGLVVPMTAPFRTNKWTQAMYRYVRLTASGRQLADKYLSAEVRQRDARGLPDLAREVENTLLRTLKQNIRAR